MNSKKTEIFLRYYLRERQFPTGRDPATGGGVRQLGQMKQRRASGVGAHQTGLCSSHGAFMEAFLQT